MRTTVNLDGEVLATAKRLAAERGQTLGEFLEGAVVREATARPRGIGTTVELPVSHRRGGLRRGIDPLSNRSLLDAADGR